MARNIDWIQNTTEEKAIGLIADLAYKVTIVAASEYEKQDVEGVISGVMTFEEYCKEYMKRTLIEERTKTN